MTIDQAVQALLEEKQKGLASRFPCRAIMVRSIEQYCDLLGKLHNIPDVMEAPEDALFSAPDVMPYYGHLTESRFQDQWLILPGVSEYLRLFSKNEAETQRFSVLWRHQASAANMGRIIIPLWGCETQWHDKTLGLDRDLRQNDFYFDCTDEKTEENEMKLVVLSDDFRAYADQLSSQSKQILIGLRAWYEYWRMPVTEQYDQILITGRHQRIQPTGAIQCHVIQDTLSFIRYQMPGSHVLNEKNCPEEAQQLLFEQTLKGKHLDVAILSALNVSEFSSLDIMGKWKTLTDGQKQLIVLWMNQHPEESYLFHCVQRADSLLDIEKRILHEIFAVQRTHEAWIAESQVLVHAMGLTKDEQFFQCLDSMPVYEERLQYLGGNTQREKVYLLHMVGKWLHEDATQVHTSEILKTIYPELYAYLSGEAYDEELRRYLGLYKTYKLSNTLPLDEEMYFSGIRPEAYDYRYPALSAYIDQNTMILWIDALGVEWLPLLLWALIQQEQGKIHHFSIAQANLPTETEFNEQWQQMNTPHEKRDRLDKLAHKGVIDDPDYYACVEEQIQFVKSIAEIACEFFKDFHRVIITGDHGTSRLAARFFHKRDGIPVPKGVKVCSHGRYCMVSENASYLPQTQMLAKDADNNSYLVFTNYDHFVQPGYAAGADDENAIYGEVHGGGTPEEMLVPVVVFDSIAPVPLTASWKKNPIKIMLKKAKAILVFNQSVQSLQASIGNKMGICSASSDNKEYTILFEGIPADCYQVTIVADGKLITAEPLTILSPLGDKESDPF